MFPLPYKPVRNALCLGAGVAGFWWHHPSPLQVIALGSLAFLLAAVLHESGIIR